MIDVLEAGAPFGQPVALHGGDIDIARAVHVGPVFGDDRSRLFHHRAGARIFGVWPTAAGHLAHVVVHARRCRAVGGVTLMACMVHAGHAVVLLRGRHARHRVMVHALAHRVAVLVVAHLHVARIHIAHGHAHVHHRALWLFAQRGHGGGHAHARREGAAGITAAVHAFGHDRISLVGGGFDDHIKRFGDADLEFVGLDRFDFLAVGGDHGHRQARHAHVEIGHGRGVDHPQADTLARREQPRPVGLGVQAVHEIGVGMARHVGDIAGAHAHFAPGQTVS